MFIFALLAYLIARPDPRSNHQFYDSLEAVKSLFRSHHGYLLEPKLTMMIMTESEFVGQEVGASGALDSLFEFLHW